MRPTIKNMQDSNREKDTALREIVSEFTTTITNHLQHETKAKEDMTVVLNNLNNTIEMLPARTVEGIKQVYSQESYNKMSIAADVVLKNKRR